MIGLSPQGHVYSCKYEKSVFVFLKKAFNFTKTNSVAGSREKYFRNGKIALLHSLVTEYAFLHALFTAVACLDILQKFR